MIDFDFTFTRSYEVEEFVSLPGSGNEGRTTLYFPKPKSRPEHDGLWLRVCPSSGKPWTGVFAFGYSPAVGVSRVLSSPDPNRVCVISQGAAYIVNAGSPEDWRQLPVLPVTDVRVLVEHELLIFSDFTHLAAYGASGVVWESQRVCWDDLRIVTVTPKLIEGVGADPTNSSSYEMRFAVDLKSGRSLVAPPKSVDGKPIW
jgi:hypothetical protein